MSRTGSIAGDKCGASRLGRFVGRLLSDEVRLEIADAAGHERIRFLSPTSAATMDLRPDRLNILTDADNCIVEIRCG